MSVHDDVQREQRNAACAEVRRLVTNGQPPSSLPLEAFGPLGSLIGILRKVYRQQGTAHCRKFFAQLARSEPVLDSLLSTDLELRQVKWTARELASAELPAGEWLVPDILPMGLATLAGRPKTGKSWLGLQIAGAVATGGRVLDRPARQGKVLYLALEDSAHRLKARLHAQHVFDGDLDLQLQFPALDRGGMDVLARAIDTEKYLLVVIDTLSRALAAAGQLDLLAMTGLLGALQDLTKTRGVTILTIDHHKKPISSLANPIDDILGSTGKSAIVDAALGLYRERGKHDATLWAIGRDVGGLDLVVRWDSALCCWQLVGEGDQVRQDSLQAAILAAVSDLVAMGQVPSTTNIARHLDKKTSNVSRAIGDLLHAGKLVKGEKMGAVQPYSRPG